MSNVNERLQTALDEESAAEERLQRTRFQYAHGQVGPSKMRDAYRAMQGAKARAQEAMDAWVAAQPPSPPEPEQDESEGHECEDNAVEYRSDGALGHGWECGVCGRFLQAG